MNGPRSLRLELHPSPLLAALIVLLHSTAAACAAAVLPGPAGAALAAALVLLGLAAAWGRALLRSRASVRALEIDAAGGTAVIELATGERMAARLAERRYASRLMVGVPLSGSLRRTLLVTRDMLPADSFRRLRIWAIWGRLPAVAGKQLAA